MVKDAKVELYHNLIKTLDETKQKYDDDQNWIWKWKKSKEWEIKSKKRQEWSRTEWEEKHKKLKSLSGERAFEDWLK